MVKINQITRLTWKRLLITILIIAVSVAIRVIFFGGLGRGTAYLTFYPAVMIAAVAGGFYSGFLSTLISAILAYYWIQSGLLSPVEWAALSVFIFSGTMISVISEAMRIAKNKALAAQMEAQRANLAKSEFLANMSHELRTPLNAILGYSALMQEDKSLTDENIDFLRIVNRSGEHLLSLINDVLEISKIEAKRISLDPSDFDLHNLIYDLKKMFELKTEAKGLVFKMEGVADLPLFVNTDITKLRIILINLIGNAIKFTQTGSIIVRFSTRNESAGEKCLIIEVEDTGPGIAESETENLFKYFMQTESGKQSKSGTGLGLAISKDYARLMGGDISVKSILGTGSTFCTIIKIRDGKEKNIIEELQQNIIGIAPGQNIPRILVAEDNDENRKLLVKVLKSIGLSVREAVNGKEAIEIFNEWQPDLIWMDIRMPEIDGLEATRIIKSYETGKQTKVVAISAHVLGDARKEIFNAGCDDFVSKPFKKKDIFDKMEKLLSLNYLYNELIPSNDSESASNIIMDLSSLNSDIITEIMNAVISTDAIKIKKIAEEIQLTDITLGIALQKCAQNFDYASINIALSNSLKSPDKDENSPASQHSFNS